MSFVDSLQHGGVRRPECLFNGCRRPCAPKRRLVSRVAPVGQIPGRHVQLLNDRGDSGSTRLVHPTRTNVGESINERGNRKVDLAEHRFTQGRTEFSTGSLRQAVKPPGNASPLSF